MAFDISGVILAGGEGKRFNGRTKSNIIINGKTIISRMADTISDIFDELIIVTNTPDEFKEFTSFKITGDIFLNAGPLGGIHAALRNTSKEALFIFAGDMPLIDRKIITRQADCFMGDPCDVLIPRIDDLIEPLHSVFSRTVTGALEEYLEEDRNYAVWEFFNKLNIRYFDPGEGEDEDETVKHAFMNVNSATDIQVVEKILRGSL
jgi:molybdopterin-guanine dinucleotide biosynthesis protein A